MEKVIPHLQYLYPFDDGLVCHQDDHSLSYIWAVPLREDGSYYDEYVADLVKVEGREVARCSLVRHNDTFVLSHQGGELLFEATGRKWRFASGLQDWMQLDEPGDGPRDHDTFLEATGYVVVGQDPNRDP